MGSKDFTARVNTDALSKVYGYRAPKEAVGEEPADPGNPKPAVLTASAYTEYLQGRTDAIFGGCFGTYDYTDSRFGEYFNADGSAKTDLGYSKPRMDNAFVNFRPTTANADNMVNKIYGAGQGKSCVNQQAEDRLRRNRSARCSLSPFLYTLETSLNSTSSTWTTDSKKYFKSSEEVLCCSFCAFW